MPLGYNLIVKRRNLFLLEKDKAVKHVYFKKIKNVRRKNQQSVLIGALTMEATDNLLLFNNPAFCGVIFCPRFDCWRKEVFFNLNSDRKDITCDKYEKSRLFRRPVHFGGRVCAEREIIIVVS